MVPPRNIGKRGKERAFDVAEGASARGRAVPESGYHLAMKKILELIVCFLHPLAVVLIWLNLAGNRGDLNGAEKLAWGGFSLIPLVPFLYVLTGGDLW